ncbi:hypothetical protein NHH82_29525 [Oxalobacteraceae bacterium OTU3REALA1]|nr:hypothetical protein NHH82_29525 [Oxalobacteraceae bacterium OTU3REALA1]
MNQEMQYSSGGLALTEQFEGCELTAYQDAGGVWTNGYGNTHGVVPGSTITQAQITPAVVHRTLQRSRPPRPLHKR